MINIIKKVFQHGVVTIEYPKNDINREFITGKPVVDNSKCIKCGTCVERCPSSAISYNSDISEIRFDLSNCIFCSLCQDICPARAVSMSHDFELAAETKEELTGRPYTVDVRELPSEDYELLGSLLKKDIDRYFGRSLFIREVDAGSCNGCDSEINALNSPYNDLERFGMHFVASPRHADMLLVTGPVTRNMELALIKTFNATPCPRLVAAVGACACGGGIFKDSYATRNGIDSVLPVDVYIPGCPPRPQALIFGILKAIEIKRKI